MVGASLAVKRHGEDGRRPDGCESKLFGWWDRTGRMREVGCGLERNLTTGGREVGGEGSGGEWSVAGWSLSSLQHRRWHQLGRSAASISVGQRCHRGGLEGGREPLLFAGSGSPTRWVCQGRRTASAASCQGSFRPISAVERCHAAGLEKV